MKKEIPRDVRGLFGVIRDHMGVELLDDVTGTYGPCGCSARHVGGEVNARTWPADLDSPEAMAVDRLRQLEGEK
jgi:hypothetical protein